MSKKLPKIAFALAAPAAAFGAFYVGMNTITEVYSKKVWATPRNRK